MKYLMVVDQAQFARLAVDDRKIDDAETDLKLRLFVEVVENDFGLLAALQFEDDAHAVAIALIADLRNAFDLLLVDQRRGVLDQARLVDLVRNLGDDDVLAIALAHGLDGGLGANFETAAARAEGVQDALPPEDETAGRESPGPLTISMILSSCVSGCWISRMVGFDDLGAGYAAGCWSPCRPRCPRSR